MRFTVCRRRGSRGSEKPFDRIEDMARYSLDAVRQVQPHGPYFFVGYSLGGLVTLEMARQLIADGEKVGVAGHAGLLPRDTIPVAGAACAPGDATGHAPRGYGDEIASGAKLSLIIRPIAAPALSSREGPINRRLVSLSPAMERVRESAYLALTRYQPRFYPGKIKFVRAAMPTAFPCRSGGSLGPLAVGRGRDRARRSSGNHDHPLRQTGVRNLALCRRSRRPVATASDQAKRPSESSRWSSQMVFANRPSASVCKIVADPARRTMGVFGDTARPATGRRVDRAINIA